jgi:hypothetical protein
MNGEAMADCFVMALHRSWPVSATMAVLTGAVVLIWTHRRRVGARFEAKVFRCL